MTRTVGLRSIWVADLRQQFAEKLHALTRSYETGESSRVRDLLDLVLLVEDGVPADATLVARVEHIFAIRKAHAVPTELTEPPASWREPYAHLADEVGSPVASYTDAQAIVAEHWRRARSDFGG